MLGVEDMRKKTAGVQTEGQKGERKGEVGEVESRLLRARRK